MPLAIICSMFEHERLNRLVRDWYRRSQGMTVREPDAFDKFMYLWVSFDAWGKVASRKDTGRGVIDFCKIEKGLVAEHHRLLTTDAEFVGNVGRLKAMCPVRKVKMRKNQVRREEVRINDIANFGEVLETIYTIRNNFFHGDKSPNDARDLELVELAFKILSKIFAEPVRLISLHLKG